MSGLEGCGGKGAATAADAKSTADADPLALIPPSAIVVASIDAHAAFASASIGATLTGVTDSLVPFGPETGFQASRDVDRIVLGVYTGGEADAAAILSGRFDLDKINAATTAKNGAAIVKGTYAGFATETIGQVTIAPISAKTVVVGTGERVHRVLDRVTPPAGTTLQRSLPQWVSDTMGTQGAQFAVGADFSSQPLAAATIGSINLSWLKGLQIARAVGDFDAPGLNVAATLTYGDPSGAQAASDGIHMLDGLQKALAPLLLGAKVDNLQVSSTANDVSCKFAVSDASLKALWSLGSRYVLPQTGQ
ncbi:MAG TPA: hypothetical protein VHV30_12055 [Polyangiaceae bacterium]|nr:hypothetical protein [Polyangiaceae bacterium]